MMRYEDGTRTMTYGYDHNWYISRRIGQDPGDTYSDLWHPAEDEDFEPLYAYGPLYDDHPGDHPDSALLHTWAALALSNWGLGDWNVCWNTAANLRDLDKVFGPPQLHDDRMIVVCDPIHPQRRDIEFVRAIDRMAAWNTIALYNDNFNTGFIDFPIDSPWYDSPYTNVEFHDDILQPILSDGSPEHVPTDPALVRLMAWGVTAIFDPSAPFGYPARNSAWYTSPHAHVELHNDTWQPVLLDSRDSRDPTDEENEGDVYTHHSQLHLPFYYSKRDGLSPRRYYRATAADALWLILNTGVPDSDYMSWHTCIDLTIRLDRLPIFQETNIVIHNDSWQPISQDLDLRDPLRHETLSTPVEVLGTWCPEDLDDLVLDVLTGTAHWQWRDAPVMVRTRDS